MSIKDTYYAALSTDAMPGIFEFQRNNSRGRAFIFHMCIPYDKTFHMVP